MKVVTDWKVGPAICDSIAVTGRKPVPHIVLY